MVLCLGGEAAFTGRETVVGIGHAGGLAMTPPRELRVECRSLWASLECDGDSETGRRL